MITFKEYITEVASVRFAAVNPKTNTASFIDSDEKTVRRVAKEKGHEFRKIFGPKYGYIKPGQKLHIAESKYDDEGMLKSMTPERAVKVLDRTRKSIASHVGRGGSAMNWRGSELRMRYDDHRTWLRVKHPKVWEKYCKDRGSHPDHDGLDMFA